MCLRIEIKVLLAVVWIYLPYNCAYCYSPLAYKHLIRSLRFPNTPFIVTKRGKQTWLFTSVLIVKWFDKTPFRYYVLERCALIYTHITKYRWSPRSWKFLLAEKVSANTCQCTLVLWKTCPRWVTFTWDSTTSLVLCTFNIYWWSFRHVKSQMFPNESPNWFNASMS